METPIPSCVAVTAALSLALASLSAQAAGTVAPGQTLTFAASDRADTACRIGVTPIPNCIGSFAGTSTNLSGRQLNTAIQRGGGPLGSLLPSGYAEARLWHDFELDGNPGMLVNAQVRVEYDLDQALVALIANSYAEVTIEMQIRDITNGPGFPVASFRLYELRRDNTQGLTDVTATQERQIRPGETGHFQSLLVTGRRYSVIFKVESMNGAFLGGASTNGDAHLRSLSVYVQQDAVALIEDLAVALEQHDQDIKARLDGVDSQLEEIRELLVTPPGRRPDWNQ